MRLEFYPDSSGYAYENKPKCSISIYVIRQIWNIIGIL